MLIGLDPGALGEDADQVPGPQGPYAGGHGIAAEARHTGDYAWDGAARDQQYVRRLAVQRAGERQAERLERRLLAKTEHLLAQEGHWRAVELIAAELLQRGVISGRTARHLFDRGRADG